MTRPELKNYQTKAFHHFDMEKYAKDLNAYIDHIQGETTIEEDGEGLLKTNVTSCCMVGPITSENYCPNCGKKIVKP